MKIKQLTWETVHGGERLKGFPFFNTTSFKLKEDKYGLTASDLCASSPKEVRSMVLRGVYNACKEYLREGRTSSRFLRTDFTAFAGDTAHGRYLKDTNPPIWKSYYWITGAHSYTTSPPIYYALRYKRLKFSPDQVKAHAHKVLKRHCRKFLKLYATCLREQTSQRKES